MRLLCRKYHFLENSKNRILKKKIFLAKQKNTCLIIVDKEPKKNYLVKICDIDCQSIMEWPICNSDSDKSLKSYTSTESQKQLISFSFTNLASIIQHKRWLKVSYRFKLHQNPNLMLCNLLSSIVADYFMTSYI